MEPVLMAIVYPMGMFAAVVIIGIVVTLLAPRVVATGVYGGVAAWLVLSAVSTFVFGTPMDTVTVAVQMLLWLLPGVILAARSLFEPDDVTPYDHVMNDPRWFIRTIEFIGKLLDQPAPPQHRQHPGHGQQPPTQPPEHEQPEHEEQQEERRGPRDVMGADVEALINALRRR